MRFCFEVGKTERYLVEFSRSSFWGTMSLTIDGNVIAANSASDLSTHFNLMLSRCYTFSVGVFEQHEVTVEHIRPLFFAGFRPNTYKVYIDGELVQEHFGY